MTIPHKTTTTNLSRAGNTEKCKEKGGKKKSQPNPRQRKRPNQKQTKRRKIRGGNGSSARTLTQNVRRVNAAEPYPTVRCSRFLHWRRHAACMDRCANQSRSG